MRVLGSNIYRLLFCILFGLTTQVTVYAQSNIAVQWELPEIDAQLSNQLTFFDAHHIDLLIINGNMSVDQASVIEQFDIPFIIDLGHQFLMAKDFDAQSNQILTEIQDTTIKFDSITTFYGAISYKHSAPPPTRQNQIYNEFIQQGDSLLKNNVLFGKFFTDKKSDAKSLHAFKDLLKNNYQYIILDYSWLINIYENYPGVEHSFLASENLYEATIALPKLPKQFPTIHWAIIVLLFLWISLAVNVATTPTYLEIIPRYFTAHRFFVDDIMSYRERSSRSSIFLLFQHAIFGGLVTYILAKVFVSTIGLEALYYHLPYIGIMGQNYFSLFVLASIIIFILELIALVWLYIPNKEMTHLNQSLNLFTWIFHLDFILVTVLVTAYFAGLSSIFISILALAYLLIWFSSFNITAFDASKRLGMTRNVYLFKTIGLHSVFTGLLVAILIAFNGWLDLLRLVVSV